MNLKKLAKAGSAAAALVALVAIERQGAGRRPATAPHQAVSQVPLQQGVPAVAATLPAMQTEQPPASAPRAESLPVAHQERWRPSPPPPVYNRLAPSPGRNWVPKPPPGVPDTNGAFGPNWHPKPPPGVPG